MRWGAGALVLVAAASTACSTSSSGVSDAGGSRTITVAGTVLNYEGVPADDDTVGITSGTFSGSARTDVNGHFSISGVPVPYDLFVSAPVGATGTSTRYIGLTRTDPTVSDLTLQEPGSGSDGQPLGPADRGLLSRTRSGAATRLVFASPENLYLTTYVLSNVDYSADGSFASAMQWEGPATTTGALYALQFASAFQENANLPVQYLGYGSLGGVSLDDKGTLSGQTVSLAPVAADTMSVTLMPTDGYSLYEETVQLSVGPNVPLTILLMGGTSNTLSFAAPIIANTSLAVSANAMNDAGAYVEATQGGLAPDASVVFDVSRSARAANAGRRRHRCRSLHLLLLVTLPERRVPASRHSRKVWGGLLHLHSGDFGNGSGFVFASGQHRLRLVCGGSGAPGQRG